jgi:putative spermidine/putrescine transport system substrate-binding protein
MRRIKLAAVAAVTAGAAVALAACGSGGSSASSTSAKSSGTVIFTAFGGSGQAAEASAWLYPFQKQTGIKVTQDSPTDYAKMQQMAKAKHVIWDVVEAGTDYGLSGNPTLTNINCKVVECSQFSGDIKVLPQGVPLFVFSYTLAYNTDKFKGSDVPSGFADFFNTKKFPGKRDVDASDDMQGMLEAALLASGVPRDKLYPLDIPRALKELDKIRSSLVFYKDAQQCINDVESGNSAMGMCYNGRVTLAKDQGEPIDEAWGQQIQYTDYLVIIKGAPDTANAQKLISYITSAAHNGNISNYIAYAPANPKAKATGKYSAETPLEHESTGTQAAIQVNLPYWNKNQATLNEQVGAWLAK